MISVFPTQSSSRVSLAQFFFPPPFFFRRLYQTASIFDSRDLLQCAFCLASSLFLLSCIGTLFPTPCCLCSPRLGIQFRLSLAPGVSHASVSYPPSSPAPPRRFLLYVALGPQPSMFRFRAALPSTCSRLTAPPPVTLLLPAKFTFASSSPCYSGPPHSPAPALPGGFGCTRFCSLPSDRPSSTCRLLTGGVSRGPFLLCPPSHSRWAEACLCALLAGALHLLWL